MTDLELVPAGAGAGKTYHIQKTLAKWVENGDVLPGRILAVTFTEAAATELRDRVRAELMGKGRIEDALEIDHAYVGTIHALGQRLLTEHAFAAGRSPESRLLSEGERDLMIRLEMAQCAALEPLMADLGRFGYAYRNGISAEEAFRGRLLKTVDLLRGLGEPGQSETILDMALEALTAGYGKSAKDGQILTDALRLAVENLLAEFPDSLAPNFDKPSVVDAFRGNYALLRKALRPDIIECDWGLWQKLRNLRVSKRGSPTPDGYDDLAEAVMTAADALPRHPGPLSDAKAHLRALVIGAQEVQTAYQAAKKRAGLMDYADMIADTEALLSTHPEILEAVLGEIDCVVIDEFQDTNPVQFSLLWRLARSAKRALIVGDTKQSIMGFQGADSRLSLALQDAFPGAVDPLDRNWRSEPRIMALINALGPKLFPNGYDPLAPKLAETGVTALEAINLPPGRKDVSVQCIANRIADLLEDGDEICDKATHQLRPVRPSDIAVLCYSHSKCADMAAELEARGLPVRLQQAGWLDGQPMRIARAALLFVADPTDVLAALTWLTLGPPCMSLEDALRNAVDRVVLTHAALDPLRSLHKNADTLPMAEITARMLSETRLRDWAGSLPDPHQALADLARLQAEAQEFDAQDPDLRAAAGFHGHGLAVFLGWIAAQSDPKLDRHPDPDGWSSTGIEISTWHAAKGREWPITVVTELTKNIAERPGSLRADFAHFDDLDEVLDHAGLAFLPEFNAPESQEAFAQAQRPVDEQEAARKLYVALTRARDRLILALPPEPKKPRTETTRMVHLLRDRAGLQAANGVITVDGKEFAARVIEGNPDEPIECEEVLKEPFLRFGTPAPKAHAEQTPWRRRPSTLAPKDSVVPEGFITQPLAPPIKPRQKRDAAELGNVWHLAFRVFASRPDLADHLSDATGMPPDTLAELQENTSRVTRWLKGEGYEKLHFELPLQVTAPDGSQTNAIIDCLAEGPAGFLILDHKSGPCLDPEARFISYLPQLQAYADLITAIRPDKPIRALAINWMSEGTLSLCPVSTKETV